MTDDAIRQAEIQARPWECERSLMVPCRERNGVKHPHYEPMNGDDWCEGCVVLWLLQRLAQVEQDLSARVVARDRAFKEFGHTAERKDGKCQCPYCLGDAELLAEMAADYELRLHSQMQRADVAESALADARQEMTNDSPILAFQAWCERRATIRGPMTQDQYFLAQEAFYAAHPGQGPTSALMSDDLAAARLRASEDGTRTTDETR